MYLRALCFILACVAYASASSPSLANSNNYIAESQKLQLWTTQAWRDLLHYRSGLLSTSFKSQADDPAFFIADDGVNNPKSELLASVRALFKPAKPDTHFSCKFPARTRWLTNALDIPMTELPLVSCPELENFRSTLNAKKVTLVFAATYLNSPSSMFGHTFLRIDNSTREDANLLLSYTISYAADVTEHENELMFAYRGIAGGYPGVTSVVPYYEKLKQYIDMENRDIWEFELNFTQEEIDQLVDHSWELMDKNFDYYFFDENCAYRLLALMDVGRPNTDLLKDVSYQAIPSDTVRWVVDKDLVANIRYRPSTSTLVKSQVHQLSEAQQQAVLDIVSNGKDIASVLAKLTDSTDRAQVLDTSFEYARYDTVLSERSREETAKLSHRLLLQRSKLGTQPPLAPPETPMIRDDQGHDTTRVSARIGQVENNDFIELQVRPAYHDITDPPDGYPEGTQLRFLDTRIRYWTKENELEVQELTLIDINSISPRDRFFKPTSWKVAVGAIRSDLSPKQPLSPYLKGGSGMATNLFDGLLFGYLQGSLQAHKSLEKGYGIGPGIELGWVRQKQTFQTLITLDHDNYLEGTEAEHYKLTLKQGFRIDDNQQIQFSFFRNKQDDLYFNEWRMEFRQFL